MCLLTWNGNAKIGKLLPFKVISVFTNTTIHTHIALVMNHDLKNIFQFCIMSSNGYTS